jgi:hypothetical protein
MSKAAVVVTVRTRQAAAEDEEEERRPGRRVRTAGRRDGDGDGEGGGTRTRTVCRGRADAIWSLWVAGGGWKRLCVCKGGENVSLFRPLRPS